MDLIQWLQKWYQQNCNRVWENFCGIEIGTLDNPGWYVHINLEATPFEGLVMKELRKENGEDDWLVCKISDHVFEGVGDSFKLKEILETFRNLIEKQEEQKNDLTLQASKAEEEHLP